MEIQDLTEVDLKQLITSLDRQINKDKENNQQNGSRVIFRNKLKKRLKEF